MGKIKTKYPLDLEVDFMLFLETSELIRESYTLTLQQGSLQYAHVNGVFQDFLGAFGINYQAYMFFQSLHSEKEELISTDWNLPLKQIEEHNRYLIIKVKSHTQYMKDLIYQQLEEIIQRVNKLEEKIVNHPAPEEYEIKLPIGSPMLHHTSSISAPAFSDKDLDIGILFSEPIFDEKTHREANLPVDFRSEILRLYSSLNNSYKPEITFECEIATKEHLKHLISYKKPKILHIICHGSKDGELEFEDDSKFYIGALNKITTDKIRQILLDRRESMPKLVFINSCYSQIIGRIFFEAGAQYCVMIDSQDQIADEAAQIFSQNFYRNIFRGEKIGLAFKEAQDNVKIKHNSFGCCCRHTARQKHKPDCRWLQLCQSMGEMQAHKMYHIPSQKCTCELRNLNQHDLTCEWAQFSLFHINNDFRIFDNGTYRFPKKKTELPKYLPSQKKKQMLLICCCFNFQQKDNIRIPHSQSSKFKILPEDTDNTDSLYQLQKNVSFRTQIIDFSAPELIESHQKVSNISVMGRQQELYEFMKALKENQYTVFFLYGQSGVGKTTFAIKASTYLMERRVFEIYFFIDLFDIKDRDMFRNKFNQVTLLGYPFNKVSMNEVKSRPMIIIFDNVDDFFLTSMDEFQEQLQCLKKEFPYAKLLLTCRQKNLPVLENQPIFMDSHSLIRELKVLDERTASQILYSKIRNYLDISVDYYDIRGIVAGKKELCIPKMLENLSHSFSNIKGKIKLGVLQEKVQDLGKGDLAFNKLIEENLTNLRNRCKESYEMLIFISQFSQGIDKNDFNILGTYDRTESRMDGYDSAIIDIPIDRNWKKRLGILFEKNLDLPSDLSKIQSETDTTQTHNPSFDRKKTTVSPDSNSKKDLPCQSTDQTFNCESFFLQEVSRNRFVVRRFIRDFIWNKDRSDQNYYMKHIFISYTAVMLDIYLNFLVSQKYIHEELLEYSDISQTGIFKYKDNNYVRTCLTESIRYVEDYNTKFERILKQQPALRQKIKSSDPSVFIMNHKLDFLHIYGYDWSKIYDYLNQNKKKQAKILINYLQRLIILIPTAMKIANMEESLIKYSIRQSILLLSQIRKYSKPSQNLMLTLKLKLMKASSEIEKGDQSLIPNTEFQKDFHMTDLEGIDPELRKSVQVQFNAQIEVLEIYLQYIKAKELTKISGESSVKISDRVAEIVKKLEGWTSNNFEDQVECQILIAKRKFILAMIYNKILEACIKHSANLKLLNFKTNAMIKNYTKLTVEASKVFYFNRMTKLTLKAKMLAVTLNWEQLKTQIKQNQFSKEFEMQRNMVRELQQFYEDKRNNLIGLPIFDQLIKKVKKEMKERVWQEAANNVVVMKAVPLSNKKNFILENIVRKKPRYRKDMETIFKDTEIDLSVKIEILTAKKLSDETKRPSTILLLNTNFKTKGDKVFLICEDTDLQEQYVEINNQFIKNFPFENTKLLILMGANASEGFKRIASLFPGGPSILSITTRTTDQFDEFEECNYDELFHSNSSSELRKAIEHNTMVQDSQSEFAKDLIKALINPKNYQKGIKDIFRQLMEDSLSLLQDFKVDVRESSTEIIRMSKGKFMDLSPGFKKAHNIDLDWKYTNSLCIYRKWKEISQIIRQFNSSKTTKYIQLCGGNGIGKSTFLQELGRICIERGLFQNGVYIFDGKDIQDKYQADFQHYIGKMSQNSTGMFNLQSFNKYADANLLLMIDDFHIIKPRSNGRYQMFLKKIISKKVNVIFVTHQSYNLRDQFPDLPIRVIKLQKLSDVELNIFAYNILKSENVGAFEEYEDSRRKRKHLNCVDIMKIYQKYLPKYNNYLKLPEEHMRKLTSNMN